MARADLWHLGKLFTSQGVVGCPNKIGEGTVDGSEIRRSPVEVGSLSHYLQGFIDPRWLAGFLPSTGGADKMQKTDNDHGQKHLMPGRNKSNWGD